MSYVGENDTFACNRLVLWDGLTFTPKFYSVSYANTKRNLEFLDAPASAERFLMYTPRDYPVAVPEGWIPVMKEGKAPLIEGDPVRSGGTTPYMLVQMAAWMGYTNIYLLGVELSGTKHVFDPEGLAGSWPFSPTRDSKLLPRWRDLQAALNQRHIRLTDCTPKGRLSIENILNYMPLEEVL